MFESFEDDVIKTGNCIMKTKCLYITLLTLSCNSVDSQTKNTSDSSAENLDAYHQDLDSQVLLFIDSSAHDAGVDAFINQTDADVSCGFTKTKLCDIGSECKTNADCKSSACSYQKQCIKIPSCISHLGGDTCGKGEVDDTSKQHESCCKSLLVDNYSDLEHPGKSVYLDKYEITTGRIKAFVDYLKLTYTEADVQSLTKTYNANYWSTSWNKYLPSNNKDQKLLVSKTLLGDVRTLAIPSENEYKNVGMDYQFNGHILTYLHGNNCSTHDGSQGFPTYYYSQQVLNNQGYGLMQPRFNGKDSKGNIIPAEEALAVKSMNCISNAMLQAFCIWDGGQLATSEVLDFVTDTPKSLGNEVGCGTQFGSVSSPTFFTGGRCPNLRTINATFDAGGTLPGGATDPSNELNRNNYFFPIFPLTVDYDKSWQISAPGRANRFSNIQTDVIRIKPNDEPWIDLAGNLSEQVMITVNGKFAGKFGLKYRGVGYQSSRSALNVSVSEDNLFRIERPESKSALSGGRCMRFF